MKANEQMVFNEMNKYLISAGLINNKRSFHTTTSGFVLAEKDACKSG